MNRISSRQTFYFKRVVPAFWFGFLALVVCIAAIAAVARNDFLPVVGLIAGTAIMAVVGYALMKRFVFDLVDEVWDCGETLLVRNNGREQRIAIEDCTDLKYNRFVNPPRLTLTVRSETPFGTVVAFIPPWQINPYSMPRIGKDLIARIAAAKNADGA